MQPYEGVFTCFGVKRYKVTCYTKIKNSQFSIVRRFVVTNKKEQTRNVYIVGIYYRCIGLPALYSGISRVLTTYYYLRVVYIIVLARDYRNHSKSRCSTYLFYVLDLQNQVYLLAVKLYHTFIARCILYCFGIY